MFSKDLKLSDDLKYWRAERPDEWIMDRFILKAKELEQTLNDIKNQSRRVRNYSNPDDVFEAIPLTTLSNER